jgi:hypothetical protein
MTTLTLFARTVPSPSTNTITGPTRFRSEKNKKRKNKKALEPETLLLY